MHYRLQLPVFKCEEDKTIFMQRLHEIAGLKIVAGEHESITLQIPDSRDKTKLDEICHYWHCELKPICNQG